MQLQEEADYAHLDQQHLEEKSGTDLPHTSSWLCIRGMHDTSRDDMPHQKQEPCGKLHTSEKHKCMKPCSATQGFQPCRLT